MNNGIKIVCAFVLGAAAGSAVSWKLLKTKYEKIAQEEIDSVKEVFSKRHETIVKQETVVTEEEQDAYEEITKNYKKGGSKSMDRKNIPYVISPEEFNDSDYRTITLTYYADHVLVDEDGEIVEDIEDVIGIDSLNRFGEYEEDSVFVRNDAQRVDYEILMDESTYTEVKYREANPDSDE